MIAQTGTIVLSLLLATAIWTDQRTNRIPNWLVAVTLCSGLILQLSSDGLAGLGRGALGVVAGLLVFLVPYLRGGMAAGDVKLLAATGAFLGPAPVLVAGGIAMLAGGSIGTGLLALQIFRGSSMSIDQALTTKFPFASAIAIGVACVLVFQGIQ